jgi:hypothetical protein
VSKEERAGKRLPNLRTNQNKIFAVRDCLIFHTAGTYGKGKDETSPDIYHLGGGAHMLGMYIQQLTRATTSMLSGSRWRTFWTSG